MSSSMMTPESPVSYKYAFKEFILLVSGFGDYNAPSFQLIFPTAKLYFHIELN